MPQSEGVAQFVDGFLFQAIGERRTAAGGMAVHIPRSLKEEIHGALAANWASPKTKAKIGLNRSKGSHARIFKPSAGQRSMSFFRIRLELYSRGSH